MEAFELKPYGLGVGVLRPLSPGNAEPLATALAAMPPWSVIGWPAEAMAASLKRERPSVHRFELLVEGELAGIVTIQNPFLHGPYLQVLAVLPAFQGRDLGTAILQWMEEEARSVEVAPALALRVGLQRARARVLRALRLQGGCGARPARERRVG